MGMDVQLPLNRGAFNHALASVNEEREDQIRSRADLLGTLWDPWTCPASELPRLAWALSVEVWDDDWPVAKQRRVVAESIALHRQKTTIAADRKVVGYLDAELVNYHLPRDGFVVGSEDCEAERRQWLLSLPEVRIYQLGPRATNLHGSIVVDDEPAAEDDIILPRARRAELIRRDGTSVPLVVSGQRLRPDDVPSSEIERVTLPQAYVPALGVGEAFDAPVASEPSLRGVFTFDWLPPSDDPIRITPGRPSLRPAETTPRRMSVQRPYECRFGAGEPFDAPIGPAPGPTDTFLSIRIADGTTARLTGEIGSAIGLDRISREPFTKELGVLMLAPATDAFPFDGPVGDDPTEKVNALREAIGSVQARRDTVFVNLSMIRPLTVADASSITSRTRDGETRQTSRRTI